MKFRRPKSSVFLFLKMFESNTTGSKRTLLNVLVLAMIGSNHRLPQTRMGDTASSHLDTGLPAMDNHSRPRLPPLLLGRLGRLALQVSAVPVLRPQITPLNTHNIMVAKIPMLRTVAIRTMLPTTSSTTLNSKRNSKARGHRAVHRLKARRHPRHHQVALLQMEDTIPYVSLHFVS